MTEPATTEPAATEPATEPAATEPATALPTDVTLLRRFAALFVDWILCLLLSFGLGASPRNPGQWPVLILIAEYAFFIGLFAQTPGMAVAGVRCVSAAHGGRIGVPRAALRGLLLALVIPALVMDENRRGWHDKAAGSVVARSRG